MLYIQKVPAVDLVTVAEEFRDTLENDFYVTGGESNRLTHSLPLAVLNMYVGESPYVYTGYTCTQELFVYTTCRHNMAGVFKSWDDNYYFFMSGRRHGVRPEELPEQLVPDYVPEDALVYISRNVDVSPFERGVEEGTVHEGTVWPSEPTNIEDDGLLDLVTETCVYTGTPASIKRELTLMLALNEELPLDVATIDWDLVTVHLDTVTKQLESPPYLMVGDIKVASPNISVQEGQIVAEGQYLTLELDTDGKYLRVVKK